jgi:hypothetical protein
VLARRLAVLACLGAAACAGPPAAPSFPRGPDRLVLASEGLLVGESGFEIGFGRAPDGAIAAVSAVTGLVPVADGPRTDCGAGILREVRYPDGLLLYFRERMLVGWSVAGAPEGRYATESGLTTGLSRASALALTGVSAAGPDVAEAGIAAHFGTDGRIVRLKAGKSCG